MKRRRATKRAARAKAADRMIRKKQSGVLPAAASAAARLMKKGQQKANPASRGVFAFMRFKRDGPNGGRRCHFPHLAIILSASAKYSLPVSVSALNTDGEKSGSEGWFSGAPSGNCASNSVCSASASLAPPPRPKT